MSSKDTTTNQYDASSCNIVFIAVKWVSENQTTISIRGSGFILKHDDKQYIVTCAHVYQQISDTEKPLISCGVVSPDTKNLEQCKKYNFYDIKFLRQHPDPRRDLCLFEFRNNNDDIKAYGYEKDNIFDEKNIKELKVTKEVSFMGYPLANEFLQMGMGVTLAASKTIISSIKYSSSDNKIDFILIDKLVNPGSSGSPVFFNDKIIGVASGTLNQRHRIGETLINVPVNIGIVRSSNYILELLKEIKK